MKKLTLLTILAAASLTACDTESETPSPTGKVQLLTAGPWHITSWTRTTNGGTPANQMSAQACQRDDRYTFGSNGVMTRTEGPTACGSGNSQTVVLTAPWNFNSSQTVLTLGSANMGASTIPYEVVRLTADAMQLRYSRTSNGNALVDEVNYVN